jgi:hypothetical protein
MESPSTRSEVNLQESPWTGYEGRALSVPHFRCEKINCRNQGVTLKCPAQGHDECNGDVSPTSVMPGWGHVELGRCAALAVPVTLMQKKRPFAITCLSVCLMFFGLLFLFYCSLLTLRNNWASYDHSAA